MLQHICGSSVWSGQDPPAVLMHSRLSARLYERCRARAKTRKMLTLLNRQCARALSAELSTTSITCTLTIMEARRLDLCTIHEVSTISRDSSGRVLPDMATRQCRRRYNTAAMSPKVWQEEHNR